MESRSAAASIYFNTITYSAEEMAIPDNFPTHLDGARVLCVAPALEGDQSGHSYDSGERIPICYHAIAKYDHDPGIYLFSVSAEHEVIGDWLEDSVETFIQMLEADGIERSQWRSFAKHVDGKGLGSASALPSPSSRR
jgi:hypothetical protein